MKVAIITDTHYGARKGSKFLHDYFEKFYDEVFFPSLEKEKITTVIHMGDAFDSRKSIDYQSLEWSKKVVFDRLKKYDVHMIVGNHDTYYKDTNDVNSPELLLQTYPNIKIYREPKEVNIGGLDILLLPWINESNQKQSFKLIKDTTCNYAMGHLELQGFRAHKNLLMDHGLSGELFAKFKKVFSGHYHTRSDDGRIYYLGNPYEMFWNDVGDRRGFTIFDTENCEHYPIDNPFKLFHVLYYNDESASLLDARPYKNKIVKIVVRNKPRPKEFEKIIDKLHSVGVQDLKIVEDFTIQENEEFSVDDDENTISILNRYIDESEFNYDKKVVKNIFQEIYKQACEVE